MHCLIGGASARRRTLLPVAREPTPFTDRIALAFELAGLRTAEVTFALNVIDAMGGYTLRAYRQGRSCSEAETGK
jgi:hypothetical protein